MWNQIRSGTLGWCKWSHLRLPSGSILSSSAHSLFLARPAQSGKGQFLGSICLSLCQPWTQNTLGFADRLPGWWSSLTGWSWYHIHCWLRSKPCYCVLYIHLMMSRSLLPFGSSSCWEPDRFIGSDFTNRLEWQPLKKIVKGSCYQRRPWAFFVVRRRCFEAAPSDLGGTFPRCCGPPQR